MCDSGAGGGVGTEQPEDFACPFVTVHITGLQEGAARTFLSHCLKKHS